MSLSSDGQYEQRCFTSFSSGTNLFRTQPMFALVTFQSPGYLRIFKKTHSSKFSCYGYPKE